MATPFRLHVQACVWISPAVPDDTNATPHLGHLIGSVDLPGVTSYDSPRPLPAVQW